MEFLKTVLTFVTVKIKIFLISAVTGIGAGVFSFLTDGLFIGPVLGIICFVAGIVAGGLVIASKLVKFEA